MTEEVVVEIPVFTEGLDPKKPEVVPAEGSPAQKAPEAPVDKAPAAPEKSGDTDEQPGKTGKSRFERRLDKAYRERAEAKAKADFLERQLAELNKPKEQAGAPRLEDFTDVQEYAKAYAKFESENAIKQHEQKRSQENFKRMQETLVQQWEAKSSRADKKYDDFDDVVGDLTPNNPVTFAIMQAENGEDIAYYLGTHLKEAERIGSLNPWSQAREIGKLEAKLLAEPPKARAPSAAPVPIKPVGGSGSPSTKKLTEMTQEEFEKRRRAQIAARR